uniref:Calcium-transporting ATPase n=1 Tax=Kalanchoe fedtschenkoi TaxID=63787 RepID=A0A7N0TUM8_KALFE
MSRILQAQTCIEYLLNVPAASTNKPTNLWRSAFATIFYSRAFILKHAPLLRKGTHSCNKKTASASRSYSVLHVYEDGGHDLKKNVLTSLVRDKDLNAVSQVGGVDGVVSMLNTAKYDGIVTEDDMEAELAARRQAYGSNTYRKPKPKGFFEFVYEAFKDITILILMGCAALSLGFGIKEHGIKDGWYDGGSIFVAVFLVIAVSAVSNFRQSRQFDKLSNVSNNIQIDVVRNGRRLQVSIFDIVVGDIVCLKIGDQVPADGLLVDGHSLQVDESSMTGESDNVEIDRAQNPFLISGTKVADGYGTMVVTAVGMNTTWGEMMSTISRDSGEETPLQARLNKLTSSIGKAGLAVAFVVLVVLLVRYFTGNTKDENGNVEYVGKGTKSDNIVNAVVGIVAAAVTIVVVAIPEGLPLAVTLTLAYSMKKMMADQAMVRKLSACETMGSATTICTDKTGTLTLNKMKVTKFWLGQDCVVEGLSSLSSSILELIKQGVALNTTGSVYRPDAASEYEFSGSPTEKAILSWAVLELKMDMEGLKRDCELVHVEAFNSEKKRSGVLIRKLEDGTTHVHWKGAAEMILAMCSGYYDISGNVRGLDEDERMRFEAIIQGMAASSLRCIAFAHKQVGGRDEAQIGPDGSKKQKLKEDGMVLLGLVGIKDPCRPGVKEAVEACQYAGVNVKMITGDNVFTARAIATECGILRPDHDMRGAVVEGAEFRNYTHEERMQKVDGIRVMARSSPFDKLLMVKCLKEKGQVVAVTGDGTNDAPALKEADIGLSMGIQGTEVAKESSDIVILDDNFASVATVLSWGRCVYTNIQKFIQFQLTVNVAALVINFVAAVSAGEVPLTAVQLLWVNLIMDTLGALALATERPTKELMDKAPVGRTEPLITNIMWRNLLAQAIYQITILLTLQFKGRDLFNVTEKVKDTLIFNIFVLCQVFNEFNARKLEKKNVFEGIHKNKLFLGIIAVTVVLQVLMVEFLKKFADTERLDWGQWGACIGVAAASWPIAWVVKCIPVSDRPFLNYLKWNRK